MAAETETRALAIFARAPAVGQTKTRLIPALGDEGAFQAHVELVESTLTRLSAVAGVSVSLWVTAEDATTRAWAREYELPLHVQSGRDLGLRMHNALAHLLDAGAHRACLVGTDCPLLDAAYVTQAFTELQHMPVVLGPAEDGGYGLIGLRQACAGLFENIEWGSAAVREQTLTQAAGLGLDVAQLKSVWDVDVPADWQRYLSWKAARG